VERHRLLEDGRIAIRCRVWSARAEAAHHVLVPGGRIDNSLLEDFIIDELAQHYRIREITFDPRYFETQAQRLSDHGFEVVELGQNTGQMADAYQHMYAAALAGEIAWDDTADVFRRHAEAAAAELTERGWKVYKLKSSAPIDALVAAVMARERCSLDERVDMWMSFT
jgi:phage terminase large subunit-like protein